MSPRILPVWLAVCALLLAVHLGSVPLLDSDEGRNAEVGREMAETNDYVMPRLNGLPYIDKPIVYFAAEAAAMEVLGPTELAARLPAYLFTLASAAMLFLFARRVWGGDTGWIAAIVFLSMPLVVAFSRTVIFDSALAFFVTVALTSFYLAIEERNESLGFLGVPRSSSEGRPRNSEEPEELRGTPFRRWAILAWLAMGFAMITKGPVTFVLVLFVVLPYAWKRRALRSVFPIAGIFLFAAVTAPWVWGVTQVVPEFLRYVLVTETAERVATKALQRTAPPWFFIPYLLGGAMPWSIVALANPKLLRRDDRALVYCLVAVAVPFLFFSLSQSKLPQYILPLMAPLALLVARIWSESRARAAAIVFLVFGAILAAGSFFVHRTKMKPELRAVTDEVALALGVAFLFGGLVALFVKRREVVLIALTLPAITLPIVANPLLRALAERRSAKAFVTELAPHLTPETHIIGVEAFSGSMVFYLQRPITLVTEDASELTSNYLLRRYRKFLDAPGSPLEPLSYFEQSLAGSEKRVYVVRTQDVKRQRFLESRGWRRVADGARYVGYGLR